MNCSTHKHAPLPVLLLCLLLLPAFPPHAHAIPPLVSGDVPTADKGHFELFTGFRYQDTGTLSRQMPFTELVYGLTERQEFTFEIPFLSRAGERGFGDAVFGTKYMFLKETEQHPGVAGSFEWKLDNSSFARGLGSGAKDYDLRLRTQKTWGWFTGIANLGYTFTGEPEVSGVRQARRDVWFGSFAQEYQTGAHTKLLSEVYWQNSEEPSEANRLAANIGFKHHLTERIAFHAAVGKSLCEGNRGGPALRVYVGFKFEF